MEKLKITVGNGEYSFVARLEWKNAPKTCEAFTARLPFKSKLIQTRWSGESMWCPLGDYKFGVDFENSTSHPSRGDILLFPGDITETEILFPYGSACFSSKVGLLAGNHFLTVVEGMERLGDLGEDVLWNGAKDIIFDEIKD